LFDFDNASPKDVAQHIVNRFNIAATARSTREDKFLRWYKLYRSYIEAKDNNKANLFIPYTFGVIETVTPRIIGALFASRPYVSVVPLKAETVDNAKVLETLLDYQLTQKINIIEIATSWVKEALIYGTSILKVGWDYEEAEVWVDEPIASFMGMDIMPRRVKKVAAIKDDPLVEHIDLWDFYVDPNGKTIDDAEYCIHKPYVSIAYLKRMEELGVFKNIDKVIKRINKDGQMYEIAGETQPYETGASDRLSSIGMQDVQKTDGKVELLEYWQDDRVVVIANRSIVIRNEENPYHHRKKPFVRLVDIPVPHEFYGIGEIEPIEHLQYELNSLRNQRMDNINLIINNMWKILRGADINPKQLVSRPGGIIEVDEMNDIEALPMTDVTGQSVEQAIENVRRDIDNANGVYDYARGETTDRRETATTASILSTAANERFKLKITLIEDIGIRRLASLLIQLDQQYIDTNRCVYILGENGTNYKDVSPQDIRGQFDVMPLGSSIEPIHNKENRLVNLINLYNNLKDSPFVNHPLLIKKILDAADFKDANSLIIENAEELLLQQLMDGMGQEEDYLGEEDVLPVNTDNEGVLQNG